MFHEPLIYNLEVHTYSGRVIENIWSKIIYGDILKVITIILWDLLSPKELWIICAWGGDIFMLHSFSLSSGFVPLGFPDKVFNEARNSAYQRICVLFFFTRIFFHRFFPTGFIDKVFNEVSFNILAFYEASRESVGVRSLT